MKIPAVKGLAGHGTTLITREKSLENGEIHDRLSTYQAWRDSMNKYVLGLLLSQIILFSQLAHAENYPECRYRCTQYYIYCTNEPQAAEPEVQAAKEAACDQKLQYCTSECERLRPPDIDMEPQSNPNIIRK